MVLIFQQITDKHTNLEEDKTLCFRTLVLDTNLLQSLSLCHVYVYHAHDPTTIFNHWDTMFVGYAITRSELTFLCVSG